VTENINGVDLHYQITGDKGEALVLVHGHPFDHTMWYPQMTVLSNHFKVITPDLRGYGKSSLPKGKSSFEDYAADIVALLDRLKIDKFHIAGLSMGGQLMMEVFRQAPDRVLSMVFADTFASQDTPQAKKARLAGAARMEKEGMEGYSNESISKMIKPEHVTSMPEVSGHVMKMMLATNPKAAAAAMRARSHRIDYLNEVFPQIKVPALVIVGRQDQFTPVAMAEEMHRRLADSKMFIIENAGHMPNLEQPVEFNTVLLAFLEKAGKKDV
jgi:pimeloyl-ACP methyl ester carboxylesterase